MEQLVKWAAELQSISQSALEYCKDRFDIERFNRIREISAEMMAARTGLELEAVKNIFCNETGYQTPKVDVRAAVFEGDSILLVKERLGGTWSLPGGWCDVNLSAAENAVKEAREEAGLAVRPVKLIALLDRGKHIADAFAYSVYNVYMLCENLGGKFAPNIETEASGYFPLDALPPLSAGKNSLFHIKMCFEARQDDWKPLFD